MTYRSLRAFAAVLAFSLALPALAADEPKPAEPDKPTATAADQPAAPGRGARGAGRLGPGGIMGQINPLAQTVLALGELNLSPDFTLSVEQKQKIQSIRDDFKKQLDKWRDEHRADIQKLQEQMTTLRGQGGPDGQPADRREGMQELMRSRQALMESAPKADEAIKQIKAVLTDDQHKKLDEKVTELEQSRPAFGPGAGAGPGGRGQGGATGGRGAGPGGRRGPDGAAGPGGGRGGAAGRAGRGGGNRGGAGGI